GHSGGYCGVARLDALWRPIERGGDESRPTVRCATHSKGEESTMHSIWRAVTLGIVVTLAVVLGVNVTNLSAQASDPRVGTWKLNVAKSKYNPGPAPQSQTLKVEVSGKGEKITSEVVSADGKRTTSTYTANFDGKDYPLS